MIDPVVESKVLEFQPGSALPRNRLGSHLAGDGKMGGLGGKKRGRDPFRYNILVEIGRRIWHNRLLGFR